MGEQGKLIDLTGKQFGRLLVQSRSENKYGRFTCWNCLCDCGQLVKVVSRSLNIGITKSCGCLRLEVSTKKCTKHGKKHTAEYRAWCSIKSRCMNKNVKGYKHYGGRGISVCDKWMDDFEAFLGDVGERPPKHSIDRIDVNGNYEPGNVRWSTCKIQQSNKRNNNRIIGFGETRILGEWAELLGVTRGVIFNNIKRGRSLEEISISRGIEYGL